MTRRIIPLLASLLIASTLFGGVPTVQANAMQANQFDPKAPAVLISQKNRSSFGITWKNVVKQIADVSAAAWTDAQLTIDANRSRKSALSGYVSYITSGARNADPDIDEANTLLRRVFQLYARYPYHRRVFFIALTRDDRAATKKWLRKKFPGSDFIANSIDSIYQTEPIEGAIQWLECAGRNTYTLYQGRPASAIILGVCPNGEEGHFEGVHGMVHEYIHTLGLAFNPQFRSDINHVIPCWLTEGEAEWAQAAVSNNFDTYLRSQHLHPYYLTQSGLNYEQTDAREWTATEVESYLRAASNVRSCWKTSQYALSYALGAAAVEVLASISGSESVAAFHQNLLRGSSFKTSFRKAFAVEWDAVVPKLAEAVAIKISRSWLPDALTYQTRPLK